MQHLATPQPARHPSPTVKATALAYLVFERPDLDKAERFLLDFGLEVARRDADVLYLRGTAPAPYCYRVLCLLGRDDVRALGSLDLQLTVNGEVRQRDSTANLIYGPAETLTELSAVHDLHAGDLIATGTPAGCALSVPSPAKQKLGALLPEKKKWELFLKVQAKRPQYLQPGDVVEARIASPDGRIDLGVQRNTVVAEA